MMVTLLSFFGIVNAQTLTIEDCMQDAVTNYPLIRQYHLIEQSRAYSTGNLLKSYLPQASFNAQATYQSDVTELPVDLSSYGIVIPSISKDQYQATIAISQQVWDGGVVEAQRRLVKGNSEVEKQNLAVSLYAVKERIIQLYFGILATDKRVTLLKLTKENLENSKHLVLSMINNGTATQEDLDLIEVELLNVEKKKIEQASMRKACIRMLGLFIGQSLSEETPLQIPTVDHSFSKEIKRPELNYFHAQNSVFDMKRKLIDAQNRPRIGLFVQGGYGRPGLNLLNDDFKFFALGGIKFTWNINPFYTRKNDLRLIEQKRYSTQVQRETFLFNTHLELTRDEAEIQKLEELIKKENEIALLRTRIKKVAESKYRNGIYQINELIRDINAESQAMQNKELHDIQYRMKIYHYNHLHGDN
jgi:outer membrane protein TolC